MTDQFVVKGDSEEKNCFIELEESLDRETQSRYNFTVSVTSKPSRSSTRRKRQAQVGGGNVYRYSEFDVVLWYLLI